MFLSSMHDSSAFSFGIGSSISARRAAIEAELRHLANFSGHDISVDVEGGCVILSGVVSSQLDLYRAMNVATDIAGADRVIFQVSFSQMAFA
ncbi:BON domain-containing protein [Agrobacterium sp. rho-13.3]|jgi:osmotically-inducible protein OsmY|uniref:BON domain-containing protein n=1 Tax=Agrobacterium sp. rho-13.3 TaxID=3072980 RepID=UPI0039B78CEE